MTRFKLAEFFSGPGGMGYGASLSKVKDSSIGHAWATDYDQDSCKTYKRNIKTKNIYCEKIENFFNLVSNGSNGKHRLVTCIYSIEANVSICWVP